MVERKRRLVSGACICPLVELGELLPNTFFWPRVNWSSFFFPLVSPATFCGGGLGWKDPIWRRSNLRKMFSGREPQSLTPRRQGELLKMMLPGGLGCGCAAQSCCRDRTHQAACLGTRQCQLFGQSGCLPLYLALSQTGRKKIPANLQGVPDCSPLQLQNWSLRVLRGIPIFAFYTQEGLKYLFSSWLVCNTNGEPVNLPHWPHPEKDLKTDTLNAHILGWSGSTLWQQTHQSTAEVGQILALLQKPPWILHAETSQNEDTQHSKK